MFDALRRFVSGIIPVRIPAGTSVVVGDKLDMDVDQKTKVHIPKHIALYELNRDTGPFVMVGSVSGHNETVYRMQDTRNGKTFTLTKEMFHIFFKSAS